MYSTIRSNDTRTRSALQNTENTVRYLADALQDLHAEKAATKERIDDLSTQMKEATQKYRDLETHIESTTLAMEKLTTTANDLRRQLSPMRFLPTEILLRVFSMTIEQADLDRQQSAFCWETPPPVDTPLLLSHVCTRWRKILLSHGSLWSHLEFSTVGEEVNVQQKEAERFHHYARLSSPDQRSLFIPECDSDKFGIVSQHLKTMQCISFKRLELDVMDEPEGTWDIGALKAEQVIIYCEPEWIETQHLIPLLRLASELTIYGNPPEWGSTPWAMLNTLIIKEFCFNAESGLAPTFTREMFIEILHATPFLRKLELDFLVGEHSDNGDDIVSHPSMRDLSVNLCHFVVGGGIFGVRLDLPALQTLEFLSLLYDWRNQDNEDFSAMSFIPHRLILPKLGDNDIPVASQLLHHFPSVESLELKGKNANTLLAFVHSSYHQSPPTSMPLSMPKLTTLHIEQTDVQADTLRQLVQAKLDHKKAHIAGVSALEVIEMYDTPSVQSQDWWNIQRLLEEGREANRANHCG